MTQTVKENQSVSPMTATGYDASRLNALQHSILSRLTVLPWENVCEYQGLLGALVAEHEPSGPTEEHLIEELAGVLWRKRRLRLAEAATYHRGLQSTTERYQGTAEAALVLTQTEGVKVDVGWALKSTPNSNQQEIEELEADRRMTVTAIDMSRAGAGYAEVLEALHESTREAWVGQLTWEPGDYDDGDVLFVEDVASLTLYLETKIAPWYAERRMELRLGPLVPAQALGEELDPDKLERLGRYEVHLDRKFERTLSTLLRLQDIRRTKQASVGGA